MGARKHVARRGGDLDAIGEGWIAIFASVLEDLANLGKLGGWVVLVVVMVPFDAMALERHKYQVEDPL